MILKAHRLMTAFILSVSFMLSGSVSAKDKVVVIPLNEPQSVRPVATSYQLEGCGEVFESLIA